jgi:hypothetical protein
MTESWAHKWKRPAFGRRLLLPGNETRRKLFLILQFAFFQRRMKARVAEHIRNAQQQSLASNQINHATRGKDRSDLRLLRWKNIADY